MLSLNRTKRNHFYLNLSFQLNHPMKNYLFLFVFLSVITVQSQDNYNSDNDYEKYTGLFDFYYDKDNDKIYLEVTNLEKEFLYVYSLSNGVGSNDIGLDRGQLGNEQVVYFKKAGNKLLLIQPNTKYKAITDNELEKKSVEQAFAKSVLFGFKIENEKGGTYIIDATDFLMQDTHGVAKRLKSSNQGDYKLDTSKSAFNLERTKAFPKNVEFDVTLTFKGEPKGSYIRSVTPNASLVTVSEHHSFIELPDNQYKKRAFDPRSGSFPFSYYDYATPVQESTLKQYIVRHRLEKKDPNATISEAKEPIIYYLDNGTPEPVRSALLEGGKWWNQAFEAIGYRNAFQLKILPDDADPMDVRYNVIQWVHRATRGWSYGSSIVDPRTGEILKGHVSLGSLRIRQDFLIAQALMNQPFAETNENYKPMLEMALARIRQLSAHEIGHTLGFAHNFAASTNNNASVMDYPHPKVTLKNKQIDLSNAYAVGIGEWDKITVAYSYSDFKEGVDEEKALKTILEEATQNGYRYITDQDARPNGGAHPYAHLWDNGADATEELEQMLKVREVAIKQFSVDNIKSDEPYTVLEDVFVPIYLFHRYQTEAAVKQIGGLNYSYAVKGSNQEVVSLVSKNKQEAALNAVLKTVDATVIAVPQEKLNLFPPRAFGYSASRESLKGKFNIGFDALSAAETAAEMTLNLLLNEEKASRLIQQKALDKNQLSLQDVLDELLKETVYKTEKDSYLNEVQNTVNYRVVWHIMKLAKSEDVLPQVNAIANHTLKTIKEKYTNNNDANKAEIAYRITQFYKNPEKFNIPKSPKIPDGSPIGMSCFGKL